MNTRKVPRELRANSRDHGCCFWQGIVELITGDGMYANTPALHIIGQLLIAFLFLGTLVMNAGWKQQQHIDRMAVSGVPMARFVLYCGFAMQLVGGLMLALDWHTQLGAAILIVFTIAACVLFHRFWEVENPLHRHFHVSTLFSNAAIIGALLLLVK
jgi:putative oxidoreductase